MVDSQPGKSEWQRARRHCNEFADWFRGEVINSHVPEHIFWLAKGPSTSVKRYTGYISNGYRFHTKAHDRRRKTQNSAVSMKALTPSFSSSRDNNPVVGDVIYYGSILEIVELSYFGKFSVTLFRCEWYQIVEEDDFMPIVNTRKLCSKDEPFVRPSQVHQIFYIQDLFDEELQFAIPHVPRELYDFGAENSDRSFSYWSDPIEMGHKQGVDSQVDYGNMNQNLSRDDVPPSVLDANLNLRDCGLNYDEDDNDEDFDDTLWDWMRAVDENQQE